MIADRAHETTRARWLRSTVAVASAAAVVVGVINGAGAASAETRRIDVSTSPYNWSVTEQYGASQVAPVPGDATELEVTLSASARPSSPYPNFSTVTWTLGDNELTGSSTLTSGSRTFRIPMQRALSSFGGRSVALALSAQKEPVAAASIPSGQPFDVGYELFTTATLTVGSPAGGGVGRVDLSADAASLQRGGSFWGRTATATAVAGSDVVVLESNKAGFFDLQGIGASVGPNRSERVPAQTSVDSDKSAISVTVPSTAYDAYKDRLGSVIQVSGISRGTVEPAGATVNVDASVRVTSAGPTAPPPSSTPTPTPTATPTAPPTAPPVTSPAVSRIAGTDRQGTAVAVSQRTFPANVPVVYIATGQNFPDALSAGPAAAKQGGPLLLVDRDSMSQAVRDELTRLKPAKIVVVGSDLSVGSQVYSDLAGYAKNRDIRRLGGVDRYDTSKLIMQYAFSGGSSKAWLATGEKFPDALSASAAAGTVDAPVVLVNGTSDSADIVTRGIISGLGVTSLTIAGSELSVSAGIERSLRGPVITRIGGIDRYDTSEKLNKAAFTSAKTVYLATGENFPDALAGATAAGYTGSPLFAVQPTCVPKAVLADISAVGAREVVLLGSTNTLSDSVARLTPCG
ncbi:putative cell wall-binding protein [Rathayibacter agropyri]